MTEGTGKSIFRRLHDRASDGEARAQYLVARCFFAGRGVARDRDLGVMWLRAAVHGGCARAARLLVSTYREDHTDPLALEAPTEFAADREAITFVDKPNLVAETRCDADRIRLCEVLMLEADRLSKVDKESEAATLILQAARYGFKPAQSQIARRYACGRGVERDSAAAHYWRECAESTRPLL